MPTNKDSKQCRRSKNSKQNWLNSAALGTSTHPVAASRLDRVYQQAQPTRQLKPMALHLHEQPYPQAHQCSALPPFPHYPLDLETLDSTHTPTCPPSENAGLQTRMKTMQVRDHRSGLRPSTPRTKALARRAAEALPMRRAARIKKINSYWIYWASMARTCENCRRSKGKPKNG
ncbi:hypothetical protein BDV19DRAFT_369587 [Aspergillus venezuelensis]